MIDIIEDIKSNKLEFQIIPKLREFNLLSLNPGDTLIAFYDKDYFTIDDVKAIYDLLHQAFPNNNILCIDNHIKLGVLKEDDKRTKTFL